MWTEFTKTDLQNQISDFLSLVKDELFNPWTQQGTTDMLRQNAFVHDSFVWHTNTIVCPQWAWDDQIPCHYVMFL